MNKFGIVTVTLAALSALCAVAQVPKEKRPEFVGTGAVVTFDELCLKTYSNFEKSNEWMSAHGAQENKTRSADPYREESTDRVFIVGSDLATYVVSFAKENRCTVYGIGVDKTAVERNLAELMSGYGNAWKTTFEQMYRKEKEGESAVGFVANVPGTDKPILMLLVSYISPKSEEALLVKISGTSLRRMQTMQLHTAPRKQP